MINGWCCEKPTKKHSSDLAPQWSVRFCSEQQHARCNRKEECDIFTPQCETARNQMGKTPMLGIGLPRRHKHEELTERFVLLDKRDRVIYKTLKKLWRKCHPVRVTVWELR